MQASYASGCALGSPHHILGTQKSMRTIQYGFAYLMRTFSKATEARSAVVAGQTEGARATERTNRHNLPSPCRTPSVRLPTSDCRPQGGHPCIERMRDAHGRSNVPRPLQRRFKARKKPEGYTSTPTGLKRLRTAKYGVSWQRERKGDAIRRPPTYTQAQTHSCKRRVRRFLFWWRRGESNPRPKAVPYQVSTVYLIESI